MACLKVAILGHSYVRDLESLSIYEGFLNDNTPYEIKYFFEADSCFDFWLNWPQILHDCIEFQPNILFVVLGSNSLVENVRVSFIKRKAQIFFEIIKNNLPNVKLVPCQVENRYLKTSSPSGTPPFERYRLIRNKLNKPLQVLPSKDFLCCIAGPRRLDKIELYHSDRINLNTKGIQLYFEIIVKTLNYICQKSKRLYN